jgi:NAD-dependent dihydropyrimidine dehydrogenase PreA subunit
MRLGLASDAALMAGAMLLFIAAVAVATWLSRGRKRRTGKEQLDQAVASNLHIPQSLYPVINPDICIGSFSCLNACPEGDILGIVDERPLLVMPSHCIGHGKCAAECPVDAIRLVMGTSERGVDLPEVDEFFESSRPGVHVVGELGGMGLIKNAMTQGVQASKHLSKQLSRKRMAKAVDVAIVGSGPAGLATALGLQEGGLTFRILEQATFGGTVAQYPRQKVVMTETLELPVCGSDFAGTGIRPQGRAGDGTPGNAAEDRGSGRRPLQGGVSAPRPGAVCRLLGPRGRGGRLRSGGGHPARQ